MRISPAGPESSDLLSSDLLAPDLYEESQYAVRNMHSLWQDLRKQDGLSVQRTPDGQEFFAALRHADVFEVLNDPATFSSAYSTMLTVRGAGDVAAGAAIHLTDPPLHPAVKRVFTPLMTAQAAQRLERGITDRMAELFDTLRGRESFDFCEAMVTLPMTITGLLMGIPEEEWAVTGRATVRAMGGVNAAESERQRRIDLFEAHTTIMSVLGNVLEDAPPADTVSGRCPATAGVVGDTTGRDVPLLNAYAFLMGANPTVPQTINQMLIMLAEDADLWSWFTRQEETDQRFVDEALRWASPVNHVLRRTTGDSVVAGTEVPAGSLVSAWIASANRDEEVFADPFRFVPDRSPNRHLAFGLGVHRCIGQHVAAIGMKIFFDLWRKNVRSVALDGEPGHLISNFLNGVVCLPLAVAWK
ncbi:cytochrome P450 [Kitasatospora purpeofusca]|uniref:cytochrome P450 n=1 Tax=Kitasatospora purpeofusca TaxID=67352 RepID=UPI00225BA9E9|nr:cytochrome P450 [Kitasatospora purpeofusca]MCX4756260.1 cytochrome P450 [Kitasatospora purpeofusca]WSR35910.1 cytochrome P450 [Kitasatospora purpeofusca]WSR44220.1 cytochrome P450 [Kitasatospora purpeofusca]